MNGNCPVCGMKLKLMYMNFDDKGHSVEFKYKCTERDHGYSLVYDRGITTEFFGEDSISRHYNMTRNENKEYMYESGRMIDREKGILNSF